MSALLPKADMCSARAHVCYGPKADISEIDADQGYFLDFTDIPPTSKLGQLKSTKRDVLTCDAVPALSFLSLR
jgi:hypothetical protein